MKPPPCVEPGKRLNPCALALHRERIEGYVALPAEWWAGWRINRQFLIGPGGVRFNAATLRALAVITRGQVQERSAVADGGPVLDPATTRATAPAHRHTSRSRASA